MDNLLWAVEHGAMSYLMGALIIAVFAWVYFSKLPEERVEPVTFEEGSTNVFADFGMPDADVMQRRSELCRRAWLIARDGYSIRSLCLLGIKAHVAEAVMHGRLGTVTVEEFQDALEKLEEVR